MSEQAEAAGSPYEVDYPQNIPVQAGSDLLGWFRDGTIPQNKVAAKKAVFNIVGFALKVTDDLVSDDGRVVSSAGPQDTTELQKLANCHRQHFATAEAADAHTIEARGKIDWAKLAKWLIEVVLPLVLR